MTNFTFDSGTIPQVQSAINQAFNHGLRIRVWYGDTMTGASWGDEYDIIGTIGRSTGINKIPLLIANKRSLGGGAILTSRIIRIDTTDGGKLYRHPSFHHGFTQDGNNVLKWGELYANCKDEKQAAKLVGFMSGERYSK